MMTAIWVIIISGTRRGRVAELCTERSGKTAVQDYGLASSNEPEEGVW